MSLPNISIVTPCLNQAATVEAALRSVFEQGYESLEYMVIDGGSTDGTAELIRRYADRLTQWVSEPDRGQADAINKGFARAGGDVFGWLNGDDVLLPGGLQAVGRRFAEQPELDVLAGACRYRHADGRSETRHVTPRELMYLRHYDPIHQPSCFFRRRVFECARGLDVSLHYGLDWDLWLRFAAAGATFDTTEAVLSEYRFSDTNKTTAGGARRNAELYHLLRRHSPDDRLRVELAYRVLWPLKRLRFSRPRWLCEQLSNTMRTTLLLGLGPVFGFGTIRRAAHPFS